MGWKKLLGIGILAFLVPPTLAQGDFRWPRQILIRLHGGRYCRLLPPCSLVCGVHSQHGGTG